MNSEQEYEIEFDGLPVSHAVKVIRKRDDLGHVPGLPDEELADVYELERLANRQDWGLLMMSPASGGGLELDNKYGGDAPRGVDLEREGALGASSGAALDRVEEQAIDIAIAHSCARDGELKQRARRRFRELVDSRYRNRALWLAKRMQSEKDDGKLERMSNRLDELNRAIRRMNSIWKGYAHLE